MWRRRIKTEIRDSLPRLLRYLVIVLAVIGCWDAIAEQRFPPPEFESGHQLPVTRTPPARDLVFQYLDVAVLAAAVGVSTWLVYRRRSRKGLVAVSVFSLLYFGFYKKGCVCAIGSVQNVALAFGDRSYSLPIAVAAFFMLPLIFALFGGRTFCASVCPHGTLQDLVLLRPIKVPSWLEQGLSILPFVYLGAGVMFAATGSAFIICQYDPFVPIFRMNGRWLMVGAGVTLLILGIFVGRPYCRFLCPYGALLKIGATLAKWRVRVTPDFCTQCKLCESSCPFGAMREPEKTPNETRILALDRKRLTLLFVALPLLILIGGWLGWRFSAPASQMHPAVALAERLSREPDAALRNGPPTTQDLALGRARQTPSEIVSQAMVLRNKFSTAGWLFGGWIGLLVGAKLISLSIRRERTDYEPDCGACFACARCFEFCPNELARRGIAPPGLGRNAGLRLGECSPIHQLAGSETSAPLIGKS